MRTSRLFLWIMLLCIAVAAVVGAATVLLGRSSLGGQVMASLVQAAVASALMLAVTKRLSKPALRPAAIAASFVILIEFVLAQAMTWNLTFGFRVWREPLELMASILVVGLALVASLRLLERDSTKLSAWMGVAISSLVLLFWLAAIHTDHEPYWVFGHALLGSGAIIVCCLVGAMHDRWHWRWIGGVAAAAAFITMVPAISDNQPVTQTSIVLLTIGVVIAHANLALRAKLKRSQRWLALLTIAAVVADGIFFDLATFDARSRFWRFSDPYERLTAALTILGACGSMALIVLGRINQKPPPRERPTTINVHDVSLICPVCQKTVNLRGGRGTCACRLKFSLEVEEPRCANCGYSLLHATAARCPECGTEAPAALPIATT